ncbi:glycosyltransferase family protein [Edaphobacter albus]|uniref:hypothetical protein n=1 Tax=Edaphobacter sp. 4G125 TaxID=2763071 RepID=UPI001645355F|nr:hypothetical protein [Edaphobacter sp. 4G125]QNI37789.1 hypothetical protein H7846_05785 [Edaphobacter sp. 4G125]
MTGQQTLIARGALGVFAGIASVATCSSSFPRRLSKIDFDRGISLAFAVSRLGLFGLIFLLLRIPPRGDVPAYYWPEAQSILHGLLPYRDFPSSYAPLHPYLDALVIRIWHSPLAIILLSILAEIALLPLWFRFGRRILSETEIRTGALLYLCSAIGLQFVAVDGQDTVIVGVFVTLSLFLLSRRKELLSGATIGTAVAAIKFLPLLYVPAFFLALPRRWRWVVGMAIPILFIYGAFVAMHLPILVPLQIEGDKKGAGSFPYVVESLLGVTVPSRIWDLLLVAVLAAIFLLLARTLRGATPEVRLRGIVFAVAALSLALLFFSKKSWPPYLMLTLFPICLSIDARRWLHLAGLAGFSVIAVVEHSYWATILNQLTAQELHLGLLSGRTVYFVFLALELALIGGYGWLLSLALRKICSAKEFDPSLSSHP